MVESATFRYEQISKIEHPLHSFYKGNYYKTARKRSPGGNGGNDEKEEKDECVIMDYTDHEHAITQIKLSRGMEYALKVLYIDNTSTPLRVIYSPFDKTISQWLSEAQPPNNMSAGKWMKIEVMPTIRELWKLLHVMKERNIQICKKRNNVSESFGDYIPLIGKKSLKLRGCEFVPEECMLLPRLLKLEEGDDHDKNYVKDVFDEVRKPCDLPGKFETASTFWNNEIKKNQFTSLNYWICSKHPIFYDPADKKMFLLLVNDIIKRYGLEGWLDGDEKTFKWTPFFDDIVKVKKEDNRNAYKQILLYKARQRTPDEHVAYSGAGSEIVRFTRNALMHFEENYRRGNNNITWHHGLDDHRREIVEILDDELNVCSIHYAIARALIAGDPPEKYTEEGWKKDKANQWKKITEQEQAAEAIRLAYQPGQLKVRSKLDWKKIEEDEKFLVDVDPYWMKPKDHSKGAKFWTREGWKLSWMELEEIKIKANQPLELHTREGSRNDSVKGWKKLEEIQTGANLLTGVSSWMKATKAFEVDRSLMSLWRRENSRKEDSREGDWKKLKEINSQANKPQELLRRLSSWKKAKEIIGVYELPMDLWTKDGWKILKEIENETNQQEELWTRNGWKALEEIKNEANQQLELWTRVSSWLKVQGIKVQEIKINPDQQLELWTMKADWKQANEIINDDQPPSLWVKKGQDEYWMEAFEADRPVAGFLTEEKWFKAREELENFFNSQK